MLMIIKCCRRVAIGRPGRYPLRRQHYAAMGPPALANIDKALARIMAASRDPYQRRSGGIPAAIITTGETPT